MATPKIHNNSMAPLKRPGAPKKIPTPDVLAELAMRYFKWVDDNPRYINKLLTGGTKAGKIVQVPTERPYTWSGLEVFCMSEGYNTRLDEYKSNRNGGYEDFVDTIKAIDQIMRAQKFDGAVCGIFNANIIASDLGLAQKIISEVRDTTDDFDYEDLSDTALEEIEKARLKAKRNEGSQS